MQCMASIQAPRCHAHCEMPMPAFACAHCASQAGSVVAILSISVWPLSMIRTHAARSSLRSPALVLGDRTLSLSALEAHAVKRDAEGESDLAAPHAVLKVIPSKRAQSSSHCPLDI